MLEKEPPLPIGLGEGALHSQSAHWRKERITTDSTSLYSDLQLTISTTTANATNVTTTIIITFLFTTAATFQGVLNHYSNSDFYQGIRNLKRQHFLCACYTSPTAHFSTEESDL